MEREARNADATYDGNTSEYYVDDVPVKKYAFEAKVDELAGEDRWRMLTSVGWFCEGLDWRKRREALFEVCGVASTGRSWSRSRASRR